MSSPITVAGTRIGPVFVNDVTVAELIDWIRARIVTRQTTACFYVNAHTVRLAHEDPAFRQALGQADLRFCDGFGVWAASRLVGRPLRERMTPPDWVGRLATALAPGQARFFFLGDEAAVVRAAATRFGELHPNVNIVGHHHGFFDLHGTEAAALAKRLGETQPTVVLVGMGQPIQERWIVENLHTVAAVFIGVGALFRWISETETRAPRWLTDHGLEWASRLVAHPMGMFDRYLVGVPLFAWSVVRWRLHERAAGRGQD